MLEQTLAAGANAPAAYLSLAGNLAGRLGHPLAQNNAPGRLLLAANAGSSCCPLANCSLRTLKGTCRLRLTSALGRLALMQLGAFAPLEKIAAALLTLAVWLRSKIKKGGVRKE